MLTKYLKILLICCISNLTYGQFVETQRWRYYEGDHSSDTTVYISQDSVFVPFIWMPYAKHQFYSLWKEFYVYDSIWKLIDKGELSAEQHSGDYPGVVLDGRLFLCLRQYTVKGLLLKKEMFRLSTGQTKEYNEHFGTYEIFYVRDIGIVAVIAKDYHVDGVIKKRSYRLLRSWSNISHNNVSRYLLKRTWKKITELNPSMVE